MIARRGLLALGLATAAAAPARAQLAAPQGRPLLLFTGRIGQTNTPEGAAFDLAMLDALPQGRFFGETPWTKGDQLFTGPLGAALLDAVGATGSEMFVKALNDYSVTIPAADFRRWRVILATRRNGAPMPVRDKGPVWIIYPMDTEPSLRAEPIYHRSVWQVSRIEVR